MRMKSIRSKVFIAIIGTTLLALTAIAFAFYFKSAQMIEDNYVTLLHQRSKLVIDTIDTLLKNVCNITLNAACDSTVKEEIEKYLENEQEEELEKLSEKMREFSNKNAAIHSMYILMPKKNRVVTTLDYPVYKTINTAGKMDDFIKKIQQNSGPVIVDDILREGEKTLSFVEAIEDEQGGIIAYVCANIEEKKLYYDYFDDSSNASLEKIYLLEGTQIVAGEKLSQIGEKFEYEEWLEGTDEVGADSQNIYVYCEGSFSGCGIFAMAKRDVILSDLVQMKEYILEIGGVFLVIAIVVASYITNIVYIPIKKLTTAMQKVSGGQIETRAEVVSQDEIGQVAKDFNQMLDQIEELIAKLIQEEKRKKDAELEALQYQITPHFMYNTLNSIKCYAFIRGEREIAEIVEDFVELLQTCINKKGAFLTVTEEVQILKNYIHLQEFRSGQKIKVEYYVTDEAQQCLIPRLILQPLVENALLHGIDQKKGEGRLWIFASVNAGRLELEVKDNGRGMSEEQIQELLTRREKKTRGLTAVGISNVRDRLTLYYGRQASLTYESGKEEGTRARICLPAKKWEENQG